MLLLCKSCKYEKVVFIFCATRSVQNVPTMGSGAKLVVRLRRLDWNSVYSYSCGYVIKITVW